MNEQWYSIVEYARTFSISDMTVRRHIKTGKIKAVMKDGKYYIPVTRPASTAMESKPLESRAPSDAPAYTPLPSQVTMPLQILKGVVQNHPIKNSSGIPSPVERAVIAPHISSSLADNHNPGHESALLDFCSKSLEKFQDMEKHIEEKFIHKIGGLEQAIVNKDLEIKSLKQTVEDLQLLVRIFEKKHT